MATEGQDFTMYQGETLVVTVTMTGIAPNAVDTVIKWVLATNAGVPLLTKTLAGGGIGNATSTAFDVYLYPADTANMTAVENLKHEARITNADGDSGVVVVGAVNLKASLTK